MEYKIHREVMCCDGNDGSKFKSIMENVDSAIFYIGAWEDNIKLRKTSNSRCLAELLMPEFFYIFKSWHKLIALLS